MGFNPRLAPYTVAKTVDVVASSKICKNRQHFPLFRFPAAGMLIGAYANVSRKYADASIKTAAIEAATDAQFQEVSIWNHAADDTTATFATGLRAAKRTGANDTSTGGGINWRWPTTSGAYGLYSLTNQTAARRTFDAGDQAIVSVNPYYTATNAHMVFEVNVQMDYILGHESA